MTRAILPIRNHSHFIPHGVKGTGLGCICREKRGMGTVTQSIESILGPTVAGPEALWSALSYNPGGTPTPNTVAASAAASQGDVLGTVGNLIEQGVQNVQNLFANAFSPTLITGGNPLTQSQVDAIKQNTFAQIDQAAAGNAALAASAKQQASNQIDAVLNGMPPAVTLPSLSSIGSALTPSPSSWSWETWLVLGLGLVATVLVIRKVAR